MPKKYVPFAIDDNGRLLCRLDGFMHPMCAFCDGLPITQFKGETALYTDVDTAIEWCRREAKSHNAEKYAIIIAVMERAKSQEMSKGTIRAP